MAAFCWLPPLSAALVSSCTTVGFWLGKWPLGDLRNSPPLWKASFLLPRGADSSSALNFFSNGGDPSCLLSFFPVVCPARHSPGETSACWASSASFLTTPSLGFHFCPVSDLASSATNFPGCKYPEEADQLMLPRPAGGGILPSSRKKPENPGLPSRPCEQQPFSILDDGP